MTPPKKAFCFAPMYNAPVHNVPDQMSHDSTGAFQPGMKKFKEMYSKGGGFVQTMLFNNHASAGFVFDSIISGIWMGPNGLDAVAYFGHGVPSGLVSAHIGMKGIKPFAAAIRSNCNPGVKIILYACSAGRRSHPGGCFAEKLAAELSDMKATVFGHDIAGHACRNPTLYRYPGGTKVAPQGMETAFARLIHDKKGDFWARFPFMSPAEIAAEVASGKTH